MKSVIVLDDIEKRVEESLERGDYVSSNDLKSRIIILKKALKRRVALE